MYDILVLGGGPGGYVAAIKAAHLGKKVALIEEKGLGGTCLNRGCIPTKALYRSGYVAKLIENASDFGIDVTDYTINYSKVKERKDNIVRQLVQGVQELVESNGIDYYQGKGHCEDKNTVVVNEKELKTHKLIIATGSVPFVPPVFDPTNPNVITSDEALELTELPKSMTIIGGGVVGTEFAAIFAALGVKVTLIEMMDRLLMPFDKEMTKRLTVFLKKSGVKVMTKAKVTEINFDNNKATVTVEQKGKEKQIETDKVLVSSGRKPNLSGTEALGLKLKDNGGIKVNEKLETNISDVYAIGDCTANIMLAHVATHEGLTAASNAIGKDEKMDYKAVPNCVFTYPELSSVGVTEDHCKIKEYEYNVSKFNFIANGKALAEGEPEGMVKIITDKDDVVIGAHILGPHSSDLIAELTLAVQNAITASQVSHTIHAHPTLAETVAEAAEGILGKIIHAKPKPKRL
ncbi:dihydrolipoyl dehydrogenase [Proteinivorax hydrogeniformans]|uniref:Dihydrolipoyl dehydrogenase n=1 Tax=Proteinivorax hydrogeniformans TaxID=1826727 RepID=A0AAU8HQX5_9FIRM